MRKRIRTVFFATFLGLLVGIFYKLSFETSSASFSNKSRLKTIYAFVGKESDGLFSHGDLFDGHINITKVHPPFWTASDGQDAIISEIFPFPGFFLDLAANDAVFMSNTYSLESRKNWTGICIEANHDYILTLMQRTCEIVFAAVRHVLGLAYVYGWGGGPLINCWLTPTPPHFARTAAGAGRPVASIAGSGSGSGSGAGDALRAIDGGARPKAAKGLKEPGEQRRSLLGSRCSRARSRDA